MRGWTQEALGAALLRRVEAASAAEAEARARNRAARRAARAAAEAPAAGGGDHAVDPVPAAVGQKPGAALVESRRRKAAGARSRGEVYRVDFILYGRQPFDWDNAAASVKEMQDAMVDLGWLPGDDWDVLEGSARGRPVKTEAEERVEAVLTRLK